MERPANAKQNVESNEKRGRRGRKTCNKDSKLYYESSRQPNKAAEFNEKRGCGDGEKKKENVTGGNENYQNAEPCNKPGVFDRDPHRHLAEIRNVRERKPLFTWRWRSERRHLDLNRPPRSCRRQWAWDCFEPESSTIRDQNKGIYVWVFITNHFSIRFLVSKKVDPNTIAIFNDLKWRTRHTVKLFGDIMQRRQRGDLAILSLVLWLPQIILENQRRKRLAFWGLLSDSEIPPS